MTNHGPTETEVDANTQQLLSALKDFDRVGRMGCTAILKVDGQRLLAGGPPYTVLISGGNLGDDFIRGDFPSMLEGLSSCLRRATDRGILSSNRE